MYMHIILFGFVLMLSVVNLIPKEKVLSEKEKESIMNDIISKRVKVTDLTIPSEILSDIQKSHAEKESRTTKKPSKKPVYADIQEDDVELEAFKDLTTIPSASPAEEAAVIMSVTDTPPVRSSSKEPWEEEYDRLVSSKIIQFPGMAASSDEEE